MAEKIGYLDGLRGLAALCVVFCHYIGTFNPPFIPTIVAKTPLCLFYAGDFMVCIFFVLSGYVLTYKYFKTKDREILISSATRRYLRLFIPVIFIVTLAFLMMSLHLFYNQEVVKITLAYGAEKAWAFTPDILGMVRQAAWETFFGFTSQNSYDYVLWTMGIEFLGSMIAFSFVMLFGQLRNRWLIYIIAIMFFLNTYYLAFILGIVLADTYNSGKRLLNVNNKIILTLLLATCLFLGTYTGNQNFVGYDMYNLVGQWLGVQSTFFHVVGAFILVFVLLNSIKLEKILSSDAATLLGRLSFSLYLVHPLVIGSASCILFLFLYKHLSYNSVEIITFLFTVLASLFFANLMYRLVDMPGTHLSKWIYEQYFASEPKVAQRQGLSKNVFNITWENLTETATFVLKCFHR